MNVVVGGATATQWLSDAIRATGLAPQLLAAGDPNRIANTLFLTDEYDFHAVAGPLLVITDPKWSAVDQRRGAAAVKSAALALPVVWVGPDAPAGTLSVLAEPPGCGDCEAARLFSTAVREAVAAARVSRPA